MSEDLKRLGSYVEARREQLGLSQMDVWKKRHGPSSTKMGDIEAGKPPTPSDATRKKLERALQWAPGSVTEVLAGGEPSEAPVEKVVGDTLPDALIAEYERVLHEVRVAEARLIGLRAQLDSLGRHIVDRSEGTLDRRPDLAEIGRLTLEHLAEYDRQEGGTEHMEAAPLVLSALAKHGLSQVSDEPDTTEDPIAAHEDGSIGGEQVDRNDT